MHDDRRLIRKADVIIIVSLLLLLLTVNLLPKYGNNASGTAVITVSGTVIDRIPLTRDGNYSYPELPNVVFTVENGAVRISENDCGGRNCIRTGAVSDGTIICVPKKIAVTVENDNSDTDVVLR